MDNINIKIQDIHYSMIFFQISSLFSTEFKSDLVIICGKCQCLQGLVSQTSPPNFNKNIV